MNMTSQAYNQTHERDKFPDDENLPPKCQIDSCDCCTIKSHTNVACKLLDLSLLLLLR